MPMTATECRKLGRTGPDVFPIGLGCMGIGGVYGAASDLECLATIQEAIDAGVNLLDTSDFYGTYRNEMLIGPALKPQRDRIVLSVKFVPQSRPFGVWLGIAGRQAALKAAVGAAMKKLGVDYIDIYRLGHLDPDAPVEETMATIAEMVQAGYIRHIGLSGLGPETIRRANAMHPIVDLQTEYSLVNRAPEGKVFPRLKELGVAATVYGAASRKLITGSRPALADDLLAKLPRFKGDHTERNRLISKRLREIAGDRGITEAQLATAWVLAKQSWIVPLTAARTRAELAESLGALDVQLTAQEISEIEAPILTQTPAETRLDGRQAQISDREHAWSRPTDTAIARTGRPAARDFVDFPTPIRAMSAEDRRFDRRRPGNPGRETVPALPDETAARWGGKLLEAPAASFEAPVRWTDADTPPKAAAEPAGAGRWRQPAATEIEEAETPERAAELPTLETAEKAAASPEAAAAATDTSSEIPLSDAVPMEAKGGVEALAEPIHSAGQAQVPGPEPAETQAAEPLAALHVQLAADQIAAIEPPASPIAQHAPALIAEQAQQPAAPVSTAPPPLVQNRQQFLGLRGKKSTRRKRNWKQPEPLIGLHLNAAAEEIAAVEESVPTMATPETGLETAQIETPVQELAATQPAEAAAALEAAPATEEIAAIGAPGLETVVQDTSVESSKIEPPAGEEPPPQLAEATIVSDSSLAAEASPAIEEPAPALTLTGTSLDHSQLETPREELPVAPAAEATTALDRNQIAKLISAIEKLVTAVAVPTTSLENPPQVETPAKEPPANQPLEAAAAIEAIPAAEVIAALEPPAPASVESLASAQTGIRIVEVALARLAEVMPSLEPVQTLEEEIAAIEEPRFATAELDKNLETAQIEAPVEEAPANQPAEPIAALEAAPTLEVEIADLEAPAPVVVAAVESLEVAPPEIAAEGPALAQPVESELALEAAPVGDEIAALEPPAPATAVSVESLESTPEQIPHAEEIEPLLAEPLPLELALSSAVAEAIHDAPQVHAPDREKAWTQLAETLGALQERPAGAIAATDTLAQATEPPLPALAVTEPGADALQPEKKTESLTRRVSKAASKLVRSVVPGLGSRGKSAQQPEKPRKQPAQAFLSLQLTPPTVQFEAIEEPMAVPVELEARWDELQPQIVLPEITEAASIEPPATDQEAPAVEATAVVVEPAAIEEPPAATEPPISATEGTRTHSNGRKSPILELARPRSRAAAAQAAKIARPTAEEIDAIEAAIPSIEPLAPTKAAAIWLDDAWSMEIPETEFFPAQSAGSSVTCLAESVVTAENPPAEALVPMQAAADAGDDVLSPWIPEAEKVYAQPADLPAEPAAEPAEIPEISAPEAELPVDIAATDASYEFLAAQIPEAEILPTLPAEPPAELQSEPVETAEIAAPEAELPVEIAATDASYEFLAAQSPEAEILPTQPTEPPAELQSEPVEIAEIAAPEAEIPVEIAATDASYEFLLALPADLPIELPAEPAEITEIATVEVAPVAVGTTGDAPPAQMLDSARTWAQLAETLSALRPKPVVEETSVPGTPPLPAAIVTQARRPSREMAFLEKEDWSEIHAWATTRHYIGR